MTKQALLIFLLGFLVLPGMVFAQSTCENYCTELNKGLEPTQPPGLTCICNPLGDQGLTDIIDNILTFLFNVALVITPLMIVVAGMFFVTAAGDPTRISRARQMLLWTAIGFATILLARGLIVVLQKIIGF